MPKVRERRVAPRPREGDIQPCPYCRAGSLQFQEPSDEIGPGWFCDNPTCGYRILPRQTTQSLKEQSRELAERSVKAHRQSMRTLARADRLKRKSERLLTTQPQQKK